MKAAEALPGNIGAIISWIFNRAADVVGWVWQKCMGSGCRYWRITLYVYGNQKVRIILQIII